MKIDLTLLYSLINSYDNEVINDFQLIENEIISSDTEDGGAEHNYVIKQLSTGKYFSGSYSDWDILQYKS